MYFTNFILDFFFLFSDRDCGEWRSGEELHDSEVLSRHIHQRVQEDHRGRLSGEKFEVRKLFFLKEFFKELNSLKEPYFRQSS